jgi:glycosyltransferase involved in cell wall biosynthesis
MKILWVSPFLPHPGAGHAGGRALYQWVAGSARAHDVTLACRLEPHEQPEADRLRPLLAGLHLLTFSRPAAGALQAASIAASYVRLGRLASRLLRQERFDLVHVDYLETALALGRRRRVPRLAIAIDELGKPARRRFDLASGAARARAWLAWRATTAMQHRVCRRLDRILTLSEQDRRTLLALDARLPVGVLPFPVGIDAKSMDAGARERDHLLFVGAMNRDVNEDAVIHFCREILPLIRRQAPAVRLTIAGAAPTAHVRRLASEPGVMVTGFVERLEPYYERATALVSPLRVGGGIISKNLDAMAAGCPVITTTIGNEGINATPGVHLLTADTPADFASAVLSILTSNDTARRLADAARVFVRERYSVDASLAALEAEHRAVAASVPDRGVALPR